MNKCSFRNTLFALIFTLANTAYATCGDYYAAAQVVMKNGISALVINPGTISEINLKVEFGESSKLSPYIGRLIETEVKIEEKMDYTKGLVSKIGEIKIIAPAPLSPGAGTSFKLLKKINCRKTKS